MNATIEGALLADRYEVGPKLACGISSSIFFGWDRTHGVPCALKVLADWEDATQIEKMLFRRRLESRRDFSVPRCCALRSFLVEGNVAVVVSDLVIGWSLAELLASAKELPIAVALSISGQLAALLAELHRNGCLLGSPKPRKILLDLEGRLLLGGGGCSWTEIRGGTLDVVSGAAQAWKGLELAVGDPTSLRADLSGWGLLSYRLLAGSGFDGGTETALVSGRLQTGAEIRGIRDGSPPEVGQLLVRCFSRGPDHGFRDAAELAAEWRRLLPGDSDPHTVREACRPLGLPAALELAKMAASLGGLGLTPTNLSDEKTLLLTGGDHSERGSAPTEVSSGRVASTDDGKAGPEAIARWERIGEPPSADPSGSEVLLPEAPPSGRVPVSQILDLLDEIGSDLQSMAVNRAQKGGLEAVAAESSVAQRHGKIIDRFLASATTEARIEQPSGGGGTKSPGDSTEPEPDTMDFEGSSYYDLLDDVDRLEKAVLRESVSPEPTAETVKASERSEAPATGRGPEPSLPPKITKAWESADRSFTWNRTFEDESISLSSAVMDKIFDEVDEITRIRRETREPAGEDS